MQTTLAKCRCGAVYERERKETNRDVGSFDCSVCGCELEAWEGSSPTLLFRLISRPRRRAEDRRLN